MPEHLEQIFINEWVYGLVFSLEDTNSTNFETKIPVCAQSA